MRGLLSIFAVAGATFLGGIVVANAAELGAPERSGVRTTVIHKRVTASCRVCGPRGCIWSRMCTGCPDGYSCYPLYGAYGPYGGQSYWAAYTQSGWGYRR